MAELIAEAMKDKTISLTFSRSDWTPKDERSEKETRKVSGCQRANNAGSGGVACTKVGGDAAKGIKACKTGNRAIASRRLGRTRKLGKSDGTTK